VKVSSEREGVATNAGWRKAMIHKVVMLMVIHNADGEKKINTRLFDAAREKSQKIAMMMNRCDMREEL